MQTKTLLYPRPAVRFTFYKVEKTFVLIVGGSVEAVRFLIDKGADVNCKGQFGRTPIYRAAFGGHVEVVQVIEVSILPSAFFVRSFYNTARTHVCVLMMDKDR